MPLAAEPLLRPQSIALIGASDASRGGWGQRIFDNLALNGLPAKTFLINPKRTELWGQKVYPNFAAIGEPVDLGLSVIPTPAVVDTLTEAAQNGLRCALVYAANFGEGGDPAGTARGRALLDLRDRYGLRICGPNCMGALALREKLLMYPATRIRGLPSGPVGVVFQSGGTFQYWLVQAATRGLGFSYAVSSGNELDLGLAEYIEFLIADENTKLIACMVEGVRNPPAFLAVAAKALAAGKPIVLIKTGRSARGKDAAMSHTGALAGDSAVFDAVCRDYGIIRCATLDDMIETCLAFQAGRLPQSDGVTPSGIGVVTYSGGTRAMFLDYAEDEAITLPEWSAATVAQVQPLLDAGVTADNPLDTGATFAARQDKFGAVAKLMAQDPAIGMLAVQGNLPVTDADRLLPEPFAEIAEATGKPVVAFGRMQQNVPAAALDFQRTAKMPFIQGIPETLRALAALDRFARARMRGVRALPAANGVGSALDGSARDALLNAKGLTLPKSAMGADSDDATRHAAAIGFPVAVKIVSPEASHKTEVGGVALNLATADTVRDAANAMAARLHRAQPEARIDGFLVQEMVSGLEMILGARTDPLYGPFVVVGLGGITVEVLNDTAIRLLPLDETAARDMLASLRCAPLLGSYRGQPPRDVDALVAAMLGLSEIFCAHRQGVTDIEINPLIVLPQGRGVRAVDVRIVNNPPDSRNAST